MYTYIHLSRDNKAVAARHSALRTGVHVKHTNLLREFRVQGSGFRVQGSGFRVQDSEFRVQGIGERRLSAGRGLARARIATPRPRTSPPASCCAVCKVYSLRVW